jgi:hypothetical protein
MKSSNLWQGVVGYWSASAGPSGYRLLDRSGRGNHGTLTNMDAATDWVVDGGRYALDFDGSNDFADLGTTQFLTVGEPYTLSWWEKITSSANTYQSRFSLSAGGSVRLLVLRTKDTVNYSPLAFGYSPTVIDHTSVLSAPSVVSSVGLWNHFVIGAQSFEQGIVASLCVINGVSFSLTLKGAGFTTIARNGLGWDGVDSGSEALLDDVVIYRRLLSTGQARQLYQIGRGGMLTPRRRRRAYSVATGLRRRLLLTGQV